jgi:energy-coupling factor transporter ATP-binding protein EcfA2
MVQDRLGGDFRRQRHHQARQVRGQLRAPIARAFNFRGGDQQQKVGNLSGGQRNRVHLAKMLRTGGNVLLLDEPTNDLDTETLAALEDALENYAGCAVIISHDRMFLDRLATHILAFEGDSHVEWFEGNFEDYEKDKIRRLGPSQVYMAGPEGRAPRPSADRNVSKIIGVIRYLVGIGLPRVSHSDPHPRLRGQLRRVRGRQAAPAGHRFHHPEAHPVQEVHPLSAWCKIRNGPRSGNGARVFSMGW